MKLDDTTRFPHPVLWAVTGDFLEGSFSAGAIQVEEDLSDGQVSLQVGFEITHPDVRTLVEAGEASAGLIIECGDTYFSRVSPLSAAGGTVKLGPGMVSGRVVIRPAIWAKKPLARYQPAALHAEFGAQGCALGKGALIAVADEQVIAVGREKLAPLETIFQLSLNATVPENEFRVDLDGPRILIAVSARAHEDISGMRNSLDGRSVLLSAVYLPVLMTVLESLQGGDATHEGKRWHSVLTAKTTAMGIDVSNCDALVAAQQLLKAPFGRTAAAYIRGLK